MTNKIAKWLGALKVGDGVQRMLVLRPHLNDADERDGQVEAVLSSGAIDVFNRPYPSSLEIGSGVGADAAEAIAALERSLA